MKQLPQSFFCLDWGSATVKSFWPINSSFSPFELITNHEGDEFLNSVHFPANLTAPEIVKNLEEFYPEPEKEFSGGWVFLSSVQEKFEELKKWWENNSPFKVIVEEENSKEQFLLQGGGRWRYGDYNFLLIDLGGGKTTLLFSEDKEKHFAQIPYGVGKGGALFLLEKATEAQLARWLPFTINYEEIADYFGNKSLFPGQIPLSKLNLALEQALAREILRSSFSSLAFVGVEKPLRVVLNGMIFSYSPSLSTVALMFLDGWGREGIQEVYLNPWGSVGLLAQVPFLQDYLKLLGTFVCFRHCFAAGKIIGRIFLDWGLDEELEIVLASGDLVRVPLPQGQECHCRLELAGGVDLPGFDPDLILAGGELGLIFDARGRPLERPPAGEKGQELVRQWQKSLAI